MFKVSSQVICVLQVKQLFIYFGFQTFFFQFQAMNLLNVPKKEAGTHDTDDG